MFNQKSSQLLRHKYLVSHRPDCTNTEMPKKPQRYEFCSQKFCGHSTPMSASSSSSRRAQAIRQCAIISGHESELILFSPLLFAAKSRKYLEDLVLGSGPSGIIIDSAFDRDSGVGFIAACEGTNFSLAQSNVLEIEVLCGKRSVVGKSIRQKLTEFIEHPPSDQNLWLRRLLFRLGRGLSTSEAEDLLRCNLVCLVTRQRSTFRRRFYPESSISDLAKGDERNTSACLHFVSIL
jgi:hypothetical protein